MKKIFIIDNYDSFTYNLVHYFEELNCEVSVKRNDQFNLKELEAFNYIVLSPGPGLPENTLFPLTSNPETSPVRIDVQ